MMKSYEGTESLERRRKQVVGVSIVEEGSIGSRRVGGRQVRSPGSQQQRITSWCSPRYKCDDEMR